MNWGGENVILLKEYLIMYYGRMGKSIFRGDLELLVVLFRSFVNTTSP
jgi:hypothetical protein